MVKLRHLLGDAQVAYYECMYTKHKTQKRKVWHDGFLALHASRRAVLHEEHPPDGKVLDESKFTHNEWDLKNYDECIPFAKFLVEVVNETPLNVGASAVSTAAATSAVDTAPPNTMPMRSASLAPRRGVGLSGRSSINTKFKSPVASNSAPLGSSGGPPVPSTTPSSATPASSSYLGKRSVTGRRVAQAPPDPFDFNRNPTSQWDFVPNAISRSANEIAEMWLNALSRPS
ncbi:hypothetical protein PINS_up014804 [Pythium insidiosum]|nr:hypothetical protein PINS_up014804 [Pythium insidiosum]